MSTTIAGAPLLDCTLTMGVRGAWRAEGRADAAAALGGAVVIDMEGQRFSGTVLESRVDGGGVEFRVVGSAGRLREPELPAKNYAASVSLGTVLSDLMRESGERLAGVVGAAVTGIRSANYQRQRGSVAATLEVLTDVHGWAWRTLDDGAVWLGAETWPEFAPLSSHVVEDEGRQAITVMVDAPELRPGVTWGGRRVYEVTHSLEPDGIRSAVVTVPPAIEQQNDQIKRATRIRFARCYEAEVISQAADGSVEVKLDDETMAGRGMGKIPLWGGPGITARLLAGSRVLVWFAGGRPDKPIALLHPDGTAIQSLTLDATAMTVNAGTIKLGSGASDHVALASLVETQLGDLWTALQSHTHPYTDTPVGPSTTLPSTNATGAAGSVGASKVTAE